MKMDKGLKEEKAAGLTRIHNAQFYNLAPRAINCMDYNRTDNKIALARNDGSIEIWDMRHTPYLEKTTPKVTADTIVESIVWAGKRLFSAGLNGEVIEWDTIKMTILRQQRVTGNAIWCSAVNKQCTELAIGTEDGYINIFDIENNEFQYKRLYDKQEGRVLCCGFDMTGNYLVTGSVNALRIWNARTGHALQKMTLPRDVDNKDTIIWTLKVLDDFSVIAGDSRGCITVYDGHTGDHLESHQVLKADVLALHVNKRGDMLVISGVEPIIRIYAKTKIKREDTTFYRWVKYLQRAVHDFDVKTLLCISEDRIISGGVDGYLGTSFITRMRSTTSRQGPFLQHPCATVAGVANMLLLRYPEYLEVWRLGVPKIADSVKNQKRNVNEGNAKNSDNCQLKTLILESSPVKLLQLRSKSEEPITCATMSPNGKFLCYSTLKEVRFFNIVVAEKMTQLQRIGKTTKFTQSVSHMSYSHDSQRLFLVSRLNKQLLILEHLNDNQKSDITLVETIDLKKHFRGCITHFTLSSTSQRFAIADDNHTIAVWSIQKGAKFKECSILPRYEAAVTTSIALHANIPRIVVAFSDSRLVEYDLEKAHYTCRYDQAYIVPNTETHCVSQILLDERNPDIIILQNDGYLYTLEKYTSKDEDKEGQSSDEDNNIETKTKKTKICPPNAKGRKMLSLRLKFKKPYENLLYTSWLSSTDLVTVSVKQSLLIEQLPPGFRQKKYGTS